MSILAIDPGTTQTGFVYFDDGKIVESGVEPNNAMLDRIADTDADRLAIEMIAGYGMAVGKEVFETCVWIGRFYDRWITSGIDYSAPKPTLIYRQEVKLHLCGSARAKDANIRQALIDKLGPQGTKKAKGPTYGVRSHAWAALAVAVTAAHQLGE